MMLRKKMLLVLSALIVAAFALVACSSNEANETDELAILEVDFTVPETADVGETVELEAFVTYDEEPVAEAEEVDYEIWEMCDKDNSVHEQPTNNNDGTYTLEYAFEEDGVYEVYAHTTAHNMHSMPKKQITVGKGAKYDCDEATDDEEHHNMEHNPEEHHKEDQQHGKHHKENQHHEERHKENHHK